VQRLNSVFQQGGKVKAAKGALQNGIRNGIYI